MIKTLLTSMVAAALTLSLASPGFTTGTEKIVSGVVTRIEGSKLTVLPNGGSEETVQINDGKLLETIKVGDRVSIKASALKKEVAKSPAPGSEKQ